jgi:hypothetical protein
VTSPCTLDLDLTSISSGCVNAGAAAGAIRGHGSSGEGEVAPRLHPFGARHRRNRAPKGCDRRSFQIHWIHVDCLYDEIQENIGEIY